MIPVNTPHPDSLAQTLVVIGHPDLARSRVNSALLDGLGETPAIHVRILSDHTIDGAFDIAAEQSAVEAVDHLVLQYPTYWYSPPALLKLWLDSVMTSPWAYGPGAPGALAGKTLRLVTSTGGVAEGYRDGAFHGWEYDTVLTPLKATARRLGLVWLDPIVIHGVRDLSDAQLAELGDQYRHVLLSTTSPAAAAA